MKRFKYKCLNLVDVGESMNYKTNIIEAKREDRNIIFGFNSDFNQLNIGPTMKGDISFKYDKNGRITEVQYNGQSFWIKNGYSPLLKGTSIEQTFGYDKNNKIIESYINLRKDNRLNGIMSGLAKLIFR